MTEKRFRFDGGSNCIDYDGKSILLDSHGEEIEELLNALHEENHEQKTTIRMLEQKIQRQINRNNRLHKDWDRLYQHLLDMDLMTDEEILKVVWNE